MKEIRAQSWVKTALGSFYYSLKEAQIIAYNPSRMATEIMADKLYVAYSDGDKSVAVTVRVFGSHSVRKWLDERH